MSTLFIQITPETTQHTIASNLTKMQYRLWLFLYHLDPFGDRPVLIPTPRELAAQLNMSVRSIQRALKKLSELELFTIRSHYQRAIVNNVKNKPIGSKHYRQRIFNPYDKNVAATTKMSSTATKLAQPRQKCRQRSSQPNQDKGSISPQTNTDNIQTLSDIEGSKNINSTANSQELVDYWFEENTCNSSSIATKDPGGESIAPDIEHLNENANSDNSREDRQRSNLTQEDGILVTLVDNGANTATNDSNVVTNNCSNPLVVNDCSFIDRSKIPKVTSADNDTNGANTATNSSNVVSDNCSNPLPDKDYSQTELVELLNNDTNSVNANGSNVVSDNCSNLLPIKDCDYIDRLEIPRVKLADNNTPGVNASANGTNVVTTSAVITTNNNSNGVIVNSTQTNQKLEARSNANPFNWLVPGPWNIEGKLDPNFCDWLAKEWIKEYGGSIAQKRANVLAYFHSKPAMLPVRWEQYRSEYLDRFTNAQTRMTNGMSIDPTEQQQLINHTAAVTNPLPAELNPVAKKLPANQGSSKDTTEQSTVIKEEKVPLSHSSTGDRMDEGDRYPKNAENPDAYKLLQPSNIDPKAGLELLKSAFTMKKPLTKPKAKLEENPLTKLNSWLADPILYPEAVRRAKKLGYSIDYNENGRATAIYELDF